MLDNLLQLIQEQSGPALNSNEAIHPDKRQAVMQTTAQTIQDDLASNFGSQGPSGIQSLFNGGASTNASYATSMVPKLSNALASKVGLDAGTATKIATMILPLIINKFVNKTNDPNDHSFSLDRILGSLGGGQAGGMMNSIKNML